MFEKVQRIGAHTGRS